MLSKKFSVGFLGPGGSFSEKAAKSIFNEADVEFLLFDSLDRLQSALFDKNINISVLPVFNSKLGALKNPCDSKEFLSSITTAINSIKVISEKIIKLNFSLLAKANTNIDDINNLFINPYSEDLCKKFIADNPQWQIKKYASSSAAAAALLNEKANDCAALASISAAREYNLNIVLEDILKNEEITSMHFLALCHREFNETLLPQPHGKMVESYIMDLQNHDINKALENISTQLTKIQLMYSFGDKLYYIQVQESLVKKEYDYLIKNYNAKLLGRYYQA